MSRQAVARLMQMPEADVLAPAMDDGRCPLAWKLIDTPVARAVFSQGLAEPEFLKALSPTSQQFARAQEAGLMEGANDQLWNAWTSQDLIDGLSRLIWDGAIFRRGLTQAGHSRRAAARGFTPALRSVSYPSNCTTRADFA
ncbi:hypothetical protein [Paracoccus beibuensis]|uniref:hypothetical protein n=1 Tax=Paracoccus beibuensis TaxID=547602 RepID=UPI00223EEE42|nr:hypothetical protein [Paracoccus beibuensis]